MHQLTRAFHSDFSRPNKQPLSPSRVIGDGGTRVFIPRIGGMLEVNRGLLIDYSDVDFKYDLAGGVAGRNSVNSVTLIPTEDINPNTGALLFRCKRDTFNFNNFLFDSDGDRHLLFFDQTSGNFQYFSDGVVRLDISVSILPPLGEYFNIGITWPESEVWVNGILVATGGAGTLGNLGNNYHFGNRVSDDEALEGNIAMAAILPPATKGSIRELTINPYQLLSPKLPPVYFTASEQATIIPVIMNQLRNQGVA